MILDQKVQIFLQVARVEGFRRAARGLGLSQSAVSFHIDKLENELGVRLFNRQGRTISLTAEGQVFWISGRQLKRALPGEPTASAIVETPPGEGEGDCSIAVTPTHIFWVHSDRGELFRVSRLGGEPISIAGGVRHVTADDDHVYWSDESQTVSRLPTVGQQEPIFAAEADREIASLAVDGDHLYYSLSIGNGGDGVIMRPKAALDEPDYLYQAGDCRADLLTPGDGGLYFACTAGLRAGEVVHVSIEQRELAVVASGQVGVGGMVSSPGYLYWVTLKQLLRLAR